jgi:hypothetical protein
LPNLLGAQKLRLRGRDREGEEQAVFDEFEVLVAPLKKALFEAVRQAINSRPDMQAAARAS